MQLTPQEAERSMQLYAAFCCLRDPRHARLIPRLDAERQTDAFEMNRVLPLMIDLLASAIVGHLAAPGPEMTTLLRQITSDLEGIVESHLGEFPE